MKHLLILQGAGAGAYDWDLPLVEALRKHLGKSYQVHYPRMPDEDQPRYVFWIKQIEKVLQAIPDPVIVLGHSLGGSVFLKYLFEESTKRKFPATFLVCSPYWGEQGWEEKEFQLPDGFDSRLDKVGQLFLYHSKEDPYVPFHHLMIYKEKFPKATTRVFENAGHEMILAVPEMVEDIRKILE